MTSTPLPVRTVTDLRGALSLLDADPAAELRFVAAGGYELSDFATVEVDDFGRVIVNADPPMVSPEEWTVAWRTVYLTDEPVAGEPRLDLLEHHDDRDLGRLAGIVLAVVAVVLLIAAGWSAGRDEARHERVPVNVKLPTDGCRFVPVAPDGATWRFECERGR